MTQKQKQIQNVKIYVGEKPKRRRAPARRAPVRRAPQPPAAGGAGGGGPLPRPPPEPPGIPSNLPFPNLFPPRVGPTPAVEPQSQLQQLVKPFQESLLRIEQQLKQPVLPPPRVEEKEEMRPQLTMRNVRDYLVDYMTSYQPMLIPQMSRAAEPSVSSQQIIREYGMVEPIQEVREIETQTEEPVRVSMGTQTVMVEPEQPLIQAGQQPLVDAVVAPHEAPRTRKVVVEDEKELAPAQPARPYAIPRPSFNTAERVAQVRQIRDEGRLTREWLNSLTIKSGIEAGYAMWDLYTISRALGLSPIEPKSTKGKKDAFIDYILRNL
jgi:hypothetical protein